MVNGVNQRAHYALTSLAGALGAAEGTDCETFWVAGDLLDSANPSPAILARTQATLQMATMPVHLLAGNHEQVSTSAGHHSLAPLAPVVEKIWDEPDFFEGVAVFPFSPTGTSLARAFPHLDDMVKGRQVRGIIGHFGIRSPESPPWAPQSATAVDVSSVEHPYHHCLAPGLPQHFLHCFAGDWHRHKRHQLPRGDAVQVGALVPTGWSDLSSRLDATDLYGSLIVWDTETGEWSRKVIPGPRFFTVPSLSDVEHWLKSEAPTSPYGYGFFRIRCDPQSFQTLSKQAKDFENSYMDDPHSFQGNLGGILVEIEPPPAAHLQNLAQDVRAADNLNGALESYVIRTAFAGEPDKKEVVERSRYFLREAGSEAG